MKTYRLLSFIVLPLLLGGCNNWLDVTPEEQIDEKELLKTGEGYRNALNGIYKSLSTYELYGRNLTWGVPDALGQSYSYSYANNSTKDLNYGIGERNFKHDYIVPTFRTIWETAYNAVANCNNILKNIPGTDPDIFEKKEPEKSMIWGEALALRAFIQFDMLRLFAPSPKADDGGKYIPYVTVYPSLVSNKLTVTECMEHIIADLKEAQNLVWKFDSTADFALRPRLEATGVGSDRFIQGRGYRLNYWGITALLARAYLYNQQLDEAYTEAKKVIKYQDEKGYFNYRNDASQGDVKFYSDVITAFYSTKLIEWNREANEAVSNNTEYFLCLLNVEEYFKDDLVEEEDEYGRTTLTSEDRRWTYQVEDWRGYGYYYRLLKYKEQTKNTTPALVCNKLIPIIRMSEVYYIAAEAIYQKNLEEAKGYLKIVKKGRGLRTASLDKFMASVSSEDKFMPALYSEARREWLGEGQIFYMYKRRNEEIPGDREAIIPSNENFVLPVPDTETNLN